jgi:hypothetical protein
MRLVKTEPSPIFEQRIIRLQNDVANLFKQTEPELRAVYPQLEWVRDELSKLLDKLDGKHV